MVRCHTPDCYQEAVVCLDGEAACAHHRPALGRHRGQDDERQRLLALIDGCMTVLDWVATVTEGTPAEPYLSLHRGVGAQLRAVTQELDRLGLEYGE